MTTLTSLSHELKYRKGIRKTRFISGIPSKYFVASLGVGVITLVVFDIISALVLGAFLLISLYVAHKDDPAAVDVFLYALKNKLTGFRAGTHSGRDVVVEVAEGRFSHFSEIITNKEGA